MTRLVYSLACLLPVLATAGTYATSSCQDEYGGYKGVWLRSHELEVFAIADPYPRILAIRMPGKESPLLVACNEFSGVRTWLMETMQTASAPLPARQKGVFTCVRPLFCRIAGGIDPSTHLQCVMDITLDPDKPVMTVRHVLRNTSSTSKPASVWAICALKREGRIIVPWGPGENPLRTLVFYPGTAMNEPCAKFGTRALGIELNSPVPTGQMKVGVRSEYGWAACVNGSTALIIESPLVRVGDYPEGGANMTFYKNGTDADKGWAEIEHVGPLTGIMPGHNLWLEERYTLLSITPPIISDPDSWLTAIQEKLYSGERR